VLFLLGFCHHICSFLYFRLIYFYGFWTLFRGFSSLVLLELHPFSVFGGFFFLSFWGDLSCHFCSSTFFLFFLPGTETLEFFSKRLFLKFLADTRSIVRVFYWNLVAWMSSVSFEYLSFCSSLFLFFLNSLLSFTDTFSMVLTYFFWSFVSYLF